MKDFENLVLINDRSINLWMFLSVSLKDDKLVFSGQDLGKSVEELWGDMDYEYWYSFSKEETQKLLEGIDGLKDPQKALKERFSSLDATIRLEALCKGKGIQYTFDSHI